MSTRKLMRTACIEHTLSNMQAVGTMNKLTDENDRANLQTGHVELDFAIVP